MEPQKTIRYTKEIQEATIATLESIALKLIEIEQRLENLEENKDE
tara:strand:- start:857 stop:991 length:135 start_codon:yes stop_codon:yes gene_type:complete